MKNLVISLWSWLGYRVDNIDSDRKAGDGDKQPIDKRLKDNIHKHSEHYGRKLENELQVR